MPAIGTTAEPTPNTTSAQKRTCFELAPAATASPSVATAVPASIELRAPIRSTSTPAPMGRRRGGAHRRSGFELEQRQVEVVEQLRADRREAEVHEGDRGLSGGRPTEDRAGRPAGRCGHRRGTPAPVDRDALARAARRAQAVEALEFERERGTKFADRLAEVVLEEEGERLDAAALADLDDEDVRRVRAALGHVDPEEVEEEDPFVDDVFVELDSTTGPTRSRRTRRSGSGARSRSPWHPGGTRALHHGSRLAGGDRDTLSRGGAAPATAPTPTKACRPISPGAAPRRTASARPSRHAA